MGIIIDVLSSATSNLQSPKAWLRDALVGTRNTTAGVTVTPATSMSLSAYYASIRNISEDIGKMPLKIFETIDNKGKVRLDTHPIDRILFQKPNLEMTPMTFKEVVTAHALGWGNGYAEIVRNGFGEVMELFPIHPARVVVKRDEEENIYYRVFDSATSNLIRSNGFTDIPQENMLHIKGLGGDGITGYSVVKFAAESLGTAIAAQEFGGSFFGNNTMVGGVLEHPQTLSDPARDNLRKSIEKRYQGADKAFKTMILEEGMKWSQTSIPPKDAQFIEVRQFQVIDIARWFRMPPHKIQSMEAATFSNIEHQSIEYVGDTMMPWVIRWEEEIKRKLIPESETKIYAKFVVQALLRADAKSRAESYRLQLNNGAISPNEIRTLEDMNQIDNPAANEYYMQLNMATIDQIANGEANNTNADTGNFNNAVEAVQPMIDRTVKKVNDKERKALTRALSKKDINLEEWCNSFYEDQFIYMMNSIDPIIFSLSNLMKYDNEKTQNIIHRVNKSLAKYYESKELEVVENKDATVSDVKIIELINQSIKGDNDE